MRVFWSPGSSQNQWASIDAEEPGVCQPDLCWWTRYGDPQYLHPSLSRQPTESLAFLKEDVSKLHCDRRIVSRSLLLYWQGLSCGNRSMDRVSRRSCLHRWAAANYDPKPDPEEVQLTAVNPHVAFGFGYHLCIGAARRLVIRSLEAWSKTLLRYSGSSACYEEEPIGAQLVSAHMRWHPYPLAPQQNL